MFWTDIARFLQYFRNFLNSFINTFAILQDFNGIFSKYSFDIMVLSGDQSMKTQNSETRNRGVSVEHCGVACGMFGCDQSIKTQNCLVTENFFRRRTILLRTFFRGPIFRRPFFPGIFFLRTIFRGPFFGVHFSGDFFHGDYFSAYQASNIT